MTPLLSAGLLLAFCCGFAIPALAQVPAGPPVLTVCEALRDFNLYRGKDVVIVGAYALTFEGPFTSEKCEPDGRILMQGHRWLSAIALWPSGKATQMQQTFPVNEATLHDKLSQVNDYHGTAQESAQAERSVATDQVHLLRLSGWKAVYGRLDSPAKLKPQIPRSPSHPRNTPGNGYGANGTVPVKILVISQQSPL